MLLDAGADKEIQDKVNLMMFLVQIPILLSFAYRMD